MDQGDCPDVLAATGAMPDLLARGVLTQAISHRVASPRRLYELVFAAALLNNCDSLRTAIFGVFWLGERFRELVKGSL